MNTFNSRLSKCVEVGDLTVADLKYWFNRPYPTCWRWLHSGYEPRGPSGRRAGERLWLLETAILKRVGFPVPADLSARERPHHITKTRHDIEHALLSSGNTSKRGR